MRSQALRADLLMLLTAMIWGSAFVAQRRGMDAIGPFLYPGLRFTLATLALLPLACLVFEAGCALAGWLPWPAFGWAEAAAGTLVIVGSLLLVRLRAKLT